MVIFHVDNVDVCLLIPLSQSHKHTFCRVAKTCVASVESGRHPSTLFNVLTPFHAELSNPVNRREMRKSAIEDRNHSTCHVILCARDWDESNLESNPVGDEMETNPALNRKTNLQITIPFSVRCRGMCESLVAHCIHSKKVWRKSGNVKIGMQQHLHSWFTRAL